jgi:hypothetical protein
MALGGGQFVIIGMNLTMVSYISKPNWFPESITVPQQLTIALGASTSASHSPFDLWQIS